MTSINVQQALDKLEVVSRYTRIIDNPYNRNSRSKEIAKSQEARERTELYKIYDRMTEEEKTEMEERMK